MNFANARTAATRLAAAALAAGIAYVPLAASAADVVNIYSQRQPDLIKPVLDAFTAETGIATEVLFLDKGLEDRIAAEGANSPADVILTVDIARLTAAKDKGVTQAVDDQIINADIPAEFRDPEGHWFALTRRGRVVWASKERVDLDALTYEELADPKYAGKFCIRTGHHDYNLALFSAMIAHWGEAKTEEWMQGFKQNLARKPDGNDRSQGQGIFAGECDMSLGNTYYVGLMRTNDKEPEQKEWEASLKVIFPTFEGGGTHMNISGMALAENSPNKDNALKLMQYLTSDEAQKIYAEQVYEYPVKVGVEASETVKSFGDVTPDTLPLAEIAKHRAAASEMVDRVGLDDGPSS
jgi:iron(III) transport system substrate-binding protein